MSDVKAKTAYDSHAGDESIAVLESQRSSSGMIKMVDVEKSYESGAGKTWVLRRINLDIAERDFITIMGPSGAGKSTLMGIIGMLDGAWKGEYYL
ncbi:MAG: ATP-binding cassette domain-containing protein, partial [Candidatus Acidiferrales bacterium]